MSDILVIDDDRLMIRLIVALLDDEGHRVRSAADGAAGLAEIARQRPDMVVLDMKMPGLSGLDVARTLRAQPTTASLPIIALSGMETPAEAEQALAAGCTAFVSKRDLPRLVEVVQGLQRGKS